MTRVFFSRPLEFPLFKASIVEPEAIVLPLEDLKLIALPVAEYKEAGGEGIQLETFLYQHC